MALFTDGPISGIDDLAAQDSQVLDIASEEDINLTQKIASAQEQIGLEILSWLERTQFVNRLVWSTQEYPLNRVVVTRALKLWVTFLSLELVYAEAFGNQLNDRYAAKRDQSHEMAEWAAEKVVQAGIGITANPVPQAAVPLVTATKGSLADGTYYITMAWLNSGGEEGASAPATVVTTADGTFLVQPGVAPSTAVAWNVYVGAGPETMFLQNSSPIPNGQPWLQPANLITSSRSPGTGQRPMMLRPVPRILQRG
ncbi:MAG: hypothetical protein JO323_02275 [Acidobacteriia bacterium]|nr:hypothetical protein [Terriglobia bacterium]